jgi:hypothetical protein
MREDETERRQLVKIEFVHDRLEIVSVGTQAVKPDDRTLGGLAGLPFDGRK